MKDNQDLREIRFLLQNGWEFQGGAWYHKEKHVWQHDREHAIMWTQNLIQAQKAQKKYQEKIREEQGSLFCRIFSAIYLVLSFPIRIIRGIRW